MSWKKPIYLAARVGTSVDDNSNTTVLYAPPFKLFANAQPLSGHTEVMAYGERVFQMYHATLPLRRWLGAIKEGDLAYLDGATPDGETVNGQFANYQVVSVRNQNLRISVQFKRLQKGVRP